MVQYLLENGSIDTRDIKHAIYAGVSIKHN